uniref:DH domain-containing protein n=1 Tax=Timema douglasi TaxID=61478 RepID=A0A7R8VPX5_TIMDO|nr:unnamed protein product [Timema douglasi]
MQVFMEPLKKIQVEGYAMFAEPELLFGNLDELSCVTYAFCKDFIKLLLENVNGNGDLPTIDVLVKLFQKVTYAFCKEFIKLLLENVNGNGDLPTIDVLVKLFQKLAPGLDTNCYAPSWAANCYAPYLDRQLLPTYSWFLVGPSITTIRNSFDDKSPTFGWHITRTGSTDKELLYLSQIWLMALTRVNIDTMAISTLKVDSLLIGSYTLDLLFVTGKSSEANSVSRAYHCYALNYTNALSYLETLRRHVEFCEFEKWCNRDPRCKKLQLTDLLVAPVQHIMKVPLILKEVESRTEEPSERELITQILEVEENSISNHIKRK